MLQPPPNVLQSVCYRQGCTLPIESGIHNMFQDDATAAASYDILQARTSGPRSTPAPGSCRSTPQPTFGVAAAGAVVNHSGSWLASPYPRMTASTGHLSSAALAANTSTKAQPPSVIGEELPAVTTPPSCVWSQSRHTRASITLATFAPAVNKGKAQLLICLIRLITTTSKLTS